MPSKKPASSSSENESAQSQPRASGTIVRPIPRMPVRRPPQRSARMPIGSRSSAPPSVGVATSSPFSSGESGSSAMMYVTRTPSSPQTIKLTSKYRNAAISVGRWPERRKDLVSMGVGGRLAGGQSVGGQSVGGQSVGGQSVGGGWSVVVGR